MNGDCLHCLVYVSSSVGELTTEELDAILDVARFRNCESGITGLLVYSGGHFIQVLEGSKSEISETYGRIQNDSRHENITRMLFEPVENRFFSSWDMAFKDQRFDPANDGGLLDTIVNTQSDCVTIQTVRRLFEVFAMMLENCPNQN